MRHPEYPDFLEEDWLYEAITETYVPILDMMERLAGENVHFRLTMSLTPPLCNMLADELLMRRYRACGLSCPEIKRSWSMNRLPTFAQHPATGVAGTP